MAYTTADEMLAQVPLFAGLSKRELREVSRLTTRLELPEGRELAHQGGRGLEFIIVLEGTVAVLIDGEVVSTCSAGEFFGEMALLEDQPRTATVIARSGVIVDVIGRRDFSVLLDHHPQISEKVHAAKARHIAEDEARRGRASSDPGERTG